MNFISAAQLLRRVGIFGALCSGVIISAQETAPVKVQIQIDGQESDRSDHGRLDKPLASNVVVWLSPLDRSSASDANPMPSRKPQLIQRNKTFEPHLLVVRVGTVVEFPNRDPFFHNVFSLFNGRRFDLGLYEAGSTNFARFDRIGVSFIFCNIHPDMSAVVVAVDTPYYGVSDRSGLVIIAKVPDGKYQMRVWSEQVLPGDLKDLTRTIVISDSARLLPRIRLSKNPNFKSAHKNKYDQDYATPPNNGYSNPPQ